MGILASLKDIVRGVIGTYVIADKLEAIRMALASPELGELRAQLDGMKARLDALGNQSPATAPAPDAGAALAGGEDSNPCAAPPEPPPPAQVSAVADYQRDDFLMFLNFVVPGMLHPTNLRLMNHAITRMPDQGAVVEIGSFAGLSLNHIIHMMQQAGRSNPLFSVDEWIFTFLGAEVLPGSETRLSDYREHLIQCFKQGLMLFHPRSLPHHIVSNSDGFFRLWEERATVVDFFGRPTTLGGPISFAYIDGDHTYEQSLRDFENVNRFLLPGGFVVFDDSADGSDWGSNRTAREAAARPDFELVDRSGNYCIAKC